MTSQPIPKDMTVHDLSGQWVMDKSATKGLDECMSLQGMSWVLRKAAGMSTIRLTVEHKDDRMKSTSVGAGYSTTEDRDMTWNVNRMKAAIIGEVEGRSRVIHLEKPEQLSKYDLDDQKPASNDDEAWLASGWIPNDDGSIDVMQIQAKSVDAGWRTHQVWGFVEQDGAKRHIRKLVVWKGGKQVRTWLVYNWLGP